jgi:hypothetical protein
MIPENSATLLWGDPGTYKTWIGSHFVLTSNTGKNINEDGAVFITFKISENAVKGYLKRIYNNYKKLYNKNILKEKNVINQDNILVISAKDPFESPSAVLSRIMSEMKNFNGNNGSKDKNRKITIKRATIFGLRRLYQIPAYKESEWEFIEVLAKYLQSEEITSLFIDWPNPRDTTVTPMVVDLCANEIFLKKISAEDNVGTDIKSKFHLRRKNYSVEGANEYFIKWDPNYKEPF